MSTSLRSGGEVDLVVVGGGVLGLAHACLAARRGQRVVLLERAEFARGASVRNFGMVWPVGQPRGLRRDVALRSRELWRQMAEAAAFRCEPTGSLHVAYHADELAVLEQFVAAEPGAGFEVLAPAEALERSAGLRAEGLRGALWSPHECNADAPAAIAALHRWLDAQPGCAAIVRTPVVAIDGDRAVTADGRRWRGERILVCSGDDFASLLPEQFAAAPLRRCRLQMLATVPQPGGWRLGPMLAAGLTLLHYTGFAACPGLPALRARFEAELPLHLRDGIHVLVSQRDDGRLVIGDSHEYGPEFAHDVDAAVETRILDYLGTFLQMPDATIDRRWTGTYAQRADGGFGWVREVRPGVGIVTGFGGAGMTLSFGVAERVLDGTFEEE
ncbi:MAG: TIGR03364 family FAD-dependent oxidoreductase [Planctomycetes bacterium]|nr:TIGR03364 family FAD-dependent oxidoreductase [Planctomycetota bacterium]